MDRDSKKATYQREGGNASLKKWIKWTKGGEEKRASHRRSHTKTEINVIAGEKELLCICSERNTSYITVSNTKSHTQNMSMKLCVYLRYVSET